MYYLSWIGYCHKGRQTPGLNPSWADFFGILLNRLQSQSRDHIERAEDRGKARKIAHVSRKVAYESLCDVAR